MWKSSINSPSESASRRISAAFGGEALPWDSQYGSIDLVGYRGLVMLSTYATVAVFLATLFYARARRGRPEQSIDTLALTSLSVVASSLVMTKVLSPQYLSWLLVVGCCVAAAGSLSRFWTWTVVGVTRTPEMR